MYKTNLKLGERLRSVKSNIGAMCNNEAHYKENVKLLKMIQKSEKKK
jgi:hypothetical protein